MSCVRWSPTDSSSNSRVTGPYLPERFGFRASQRSANIPDPFPPIRSDRGPAAPKSTILYKMTSMIWYRTWRFDQALSVRPAAPRVPPRAGHSGHDRHWFLLLLLGCILSGCSWLPRSRSDSIAESQRLIEQARVAEQEDDLDRAAKQLEQAARKNPDNPEIHRRLGHILIAQGNTTAAVELLRYASARNPDDVAGHVELARLLADLHKETEAENAVSTALRLEPNHIEAMMLKGMLARKQHRDQQALQMYHRVLAREPDHVEARLRIAAIQLDSERPERASPLLRSICASRYATGCQAAEAKWSLGIAYGKEGRWAESACALEQSVRNREMVSADDWYRLAYAKHQVGDVTGARRYLAMALEENPRHPNSLEMAAALDPRWGIPRTPDSRVATVPGDLPRIVPHLAR